MAKRSYRKPPSQPPADAEAGAALIRGHAVKLFDRQDGEGADLRKVTEALFKAAFDALDRLPDDACRVVARRVHAGAYERVAEGPKADSAAGKTGPSRAGSAPSNTADLESKPPAR